VRLTWKIVSVMLIIACVVLILNLVEQNNVDKVYDINGFEISKSTLDDISSSMNNEPFQICNSQNKCIIVGKLN